MSAAFAAAAAAAAANANGRDGGDAERRISESGGNPADQGAKLGFPEIPPSSSSAGKLPFVQQPQQPPLGQQHHQLAAAHAKGLLGKGANGQPMPLSPPLTPLPPALPRFPTSMPMLPPGVAAAAAAASGASPSPFQQASNLQSLLLAAQYHPLLAARAGLQLPLPAAAAPAVPPNLEMMEHLQRLLQFKKQQAELQAAAMASELQQQQQQQQEQNEERIKEEESKLLLRKNFVSGEKGSIAAATPEKEIGFKGGFGKSSSPEDLKREEEMVDDEMKEEIRAAATGGGKMMVDERPESPPPPIREQPPQHPQNDLAQLLKQHLETSSKLALMKKILDAGQGAGGGDSQDPESILQLLRRQQEMASAAVAAAVNSRDKVSAPESGQSGTPSPAPPVAPLPPSGVGNCDVAASSSTPPDRPDSACSGDGDQDSQDGMVLMSSGSNNASGMMGMNNSGLSDSSMGGQNSSSNSFGGNGGALGGGSQHGSADERKVRVRTLISEDQLAILKAYYLANPRPKREELERIAAKIGHPFKVVKVWFQNSRARDRREGKPVSQQAAGAGVPVPNDCGNGSSAAQPSVAPNPVLNPAANLSLLSQMMNGPHAAAAAAAAGASPLLNGGVGTNIPNLFSPLNLFPGIMGAQQQQQQLNGFSGSPVPGSAASQALLNRDSKSPGSSIDSDSNGGPPAGGRKGGSGEQPLDLSAKGSSPSVSPVSSHADNLAQPPSPSPIIPNFSGVGGQLSAGRFSPSQLKFPGASPAAAFPFLPQGFPGASAASAASAASFSGLKGGLYSAFEEDVDVVSEEDGQFACNINKCDKTFSKRSSLARHKYEHSGN